MKKILIIIISIVSVLTVNAQIETRFSSEQSVLETVKIIKDNKKAKLVKKFMSFDVQKRLDEDAANEGLDIPFRFGEGFDTDITLSEENWTKIKNGRLWSMEFESAGAYSINFVFNDFYLPEGAELYIANREGTMLYGPVTSKQNTQNGFFLTDLVQGDNVTLYLFEPAEKHGQARLTIKRVVHAYKNLFANFLYGDNGTSESCNNNIDLFPAWDLESDAVALVLLSSGTEWCSGSLLMTANQSFRPFFLTAFHCIDVSGNGDLSATEISNAENWMFKFQYRQSTYTGNSSTSGITYNGAEFRAAWNNTDFALMEMDNPPTGDTRFSWLGWDRSGNTPTSGTGIHHPAGDLMKISFEENQFQVFSWNVTNDHWSVRFDDGVVQHGSSGSPILNQDRRVVGQLHGNYDYNGTFSYCLQRRADYGRFNLSWTGGGTNTTRLSNWLDPTGSGVIVTNTARFSTITGPPTVCYSGSTFTLGSAPQGTVTWSVSGPFTVTGNGTTATVTRTGTSTSNGTLTAILNGTAVATLTITPCSPATISGPASTCGSTVDYSISISTLPAGTTASQITWTCSSNLSPQYGNNGLNKRFNVTGSGSGWVRVHIATLNLTLEKNVFLTPFPAYTAHTIQFPYCGETMYMGPGIIPGVIDYRWEVVYGQGRHYLVNYSSGPSGPPGPWASVSFYGNGYWVIHAYAITACGESPDVTHEYVFQVAGCRSYSPSFAYPNPVSGILTIDVDAAAAARSKPAVQSITGAQSLKPAAAYDLRLYDGQGNLLRQRKTSGGTVEFNVANLPNGVYYLHIYDGTGEKPTVQQIVIEH